MMKKLVSIPLALGLIGASSVANAAIVISSAGQGYAQGFDTLFVFGGIHAVEVLDERGELVAERLAHLFAEAGAWPAAVIRRLVW